MSARSIDGVIDPLDGIITQTEQRGGRVGDFAAR